MFTLYSVPCRLQSGWVINVFQFFKRRTNFESFQIHASLNFALTKKTFDQFLPEKKTKINKIFHSRQYFEFYCFFFDVDFSSFAFFFLPLRSYLFHNFYLSIRSILLLVVVFKTELKSIYQIFLPFMLHIYQIHISSSKWLFILVEPIFRYFVLLLSPSPQKIKTDAVS